MAIAEWRTWCVAEDLSVTADVVEVLVGRSRAHRVKVVEHADAFRLIGTVVGSRLSGLDDLELDVWQRNRRLILVGLRFDEQDRLVGESWVPKAGLTKDEFLVYVRTLARECDRYEFQLTGQDRM